MSAIHDNLKQIRMEKGMTQEAVAEKIGLTRQAVSSYESGRTQPSVDLLMKFAQIYKVELEDILYGTNEAQMGRRKVKRAAILVAVSFLLLQLIMGSISVATQILYPLTGEVATGEVINEDNRDIITLHFETYDMSVKVEAVSAVVLNVGILIVVILDLTEKGSFSWKMKTGYCLIFLVSSWFIAILTGAIDPVFGMIDYVLRGPIRFTNVFLFLAIDLIVTAGKKKRQKENEKTTG